jgi:histidinol-phosphate/aromatic aminotransferase/cobyric acid decarboxylase-like protein
VITAIQNQLLYIDQYPTPGYSDLCQSLADHHQIEHDWILPGNGAAELLTWAGRELAQYPQTILLTPAFNDYARALTAFEAQIDRYPLIDAAGQLQDLEQVLAIAPATAGLIINNPHNPTGQLFDKQLLINCLEKFALVVVDESFLDFVPPAQSLVDVVAKYPNLIIIRSLTKFYSLPGLRVGYCISHPGRLRQWQAWRDPWGVNRLAEVAAIAALADQNFIDRTWQWYNSAQPQLFTGLQNIAGLQVYPSMVNFFLFKSSLLVPELQRQLLQEFQILIRDCLSFPELGASYGRVAVKSIADNQKLLVALAKILEL